MADEIDATCSTFKQFAELAMTQRQEGMTLSNHRLVIKGVLNEHKSPGSYDIVNLYYSIAWQVPIFTEPSQKAEAVTFTNKIGSQCITDLRS